MKGMTRRQELFLTIASNLVLQAVTAACGFVLPPLVVRTFGSEINGMVSSIAQFIAYLNLVEAGVGAASIAALYRPLAEGDTGRVSGIVSAARKFYCKNGALFSAGIVLLAFAYPLAVGREVDRMQAGLMVLVLGITGAAEFFLIGKYRVLLTADKKLYVISFLQAAATALNTAVAVVLIKFGMGILSVKLASSLVYLLRFAVLALYVRKNYGSVSFRSEPDAKSISQSKNALVHQISGFVVFNSPVIILTVLCGLKEVSVYSVYALVFSAVNNLASSFITGLQSFFGESLVKDTGERIRKFYSAYEMSFFAVMLALYSCAYLLIMPFMSLYTAGMTDAQYMRPALASLFALSGILTNMRSPGGQMISAAGHFAQTQLRSLTEAAINIAASILFTARLGINGVVLGAICSSLYRGVDVVVYTDTRILGRKSAVSFLRIFILATVFALLVFCCKKIRLDCPSWEKWIMNACAVSAVFSLPAAFIVLHSRKSVQRKKA